MHLEVNDLEVQERGSQVLPTAVGNQNRHASSRTLLRTTWGDSKHESLCGLHLGSFNCRLCRVPMRLLLEFVIAFDTSLGDTVDTKYPA